MTIIDMASARKARNAPDANCIKTDQHGIPMGLYALDYTMDGKTYGLELWAYSWDDAEIRVTAMCNTLTVAGQIKAIIPG